MNFLKSIKSTFRYLLRAVLLLIKRYLPSLPIVFGPLKGTSLSTDTISESPSILSGRYESGLVKLIGEFASGDCVFYDIGAHHGFWSILFSKACKGICYSFEPGVAEHLILSENLYRNNLQRRIIPVNKAVCDHSGTAKFEIGVSSFTGMLLSGSQFKGKGKSIITVQCTSIDDFVIQGFRRPDFIKIDVEGAEALVLKGATKVLRDFSPVLLIELHGPAAAADSITALLDCNYCLYVVDNNQRFEVSCFADISSFFSKKSWTLHILCLPKATHHQFV